MSNKKEIHAILRSGQTIWPATATDAVGHPELGVDLTSLINEYNIDSIWPNGWPIGDSCYSLNTALDKISIALLDKDKVLGTNIKFKGSSGKVEDWTYSDSTKTFSDPTAWEKSLSVDTALDATSENPISNSIATQSFITSSPTGDDAGDVEENLIITALRKTPQTLTDEEQAQARTNIGAAPASLVEVVERNSEEIQRLSSSAYYAGSFGPNTSLTTLTIDSGDSSLLNKMSAYLLDTSDNSSSNGTVPVAILNPANFLRSKTTGNFVPAVGITVEQYNECFGDDYTFYTYDSENIAYEPIEAYDGGFDPDAEWAIDKELIANGEDPRTIYTSTNGETFHAVTHKVRPWETTETKYTIGVGYPETIYLLDEELGNSNKVWIGLFKNPTIWDGITISSDNKVNPFAISPDSCATIVNGLTEQSRCFYYLYRTSTRCKGQDGLHQNISIFNNRNRTYPRTGLSQVEAGEKSRIGESMTYHEGSWRALSTMISLERLKAENKNFWSSHDQGQEISVLTNEDSFKNVLINGGVKYTCVEDGSSDTNHFASFDDIANIYYTIDTTEGATNEDDPQVKWRDILNQGWPASPVMEAQMALSYANEIGVLSSSITGGTMNYFDFYGNTYYWYYGDGVLSVALDENSKMTNLTVGRVDTIVAKFYEDPVEGIETGYERVSKDYQLTIYTVTSLYDGINFGSDRLNYWNGGIEVVNNVSSGVTTGIDLYYQPDPTEWILPGSPITTNTDFSWVSEYKYATHTGASLDGVPKRRYPYTPFGSTTDPASSNNLGEGYQVKAGITTSGLSDGKTRLFTAIGRIPLETGSVVRTIRATGPANSQLNTCAPTLEAKLNI